MPKTTVVVSAENPHCAWYVGYSGVGALEAARQETVIDQFQIHTGQRTGPFQQPRQINEGVRAHARAQMQQAILASPKLSRLAMVRPASSQAIAPQTENGKEKKGKGKGDSKKGKKRGKAKKQADNLS